MSLFASFSTGPGRVHFGFVSYRVFPRVGTRLLPTEERKESLSHFMEELDKPTLRAART